MKYGKMLNSTTTAAPATSHFAMSEKRMGIIMHGKDGTSAALAASRRVPSPERYLNQGRES